MKQEIASKIGQDKVQDPRDAIGAAPYKDNVDGSQTGRTVDFMPGPMDESPPFKVTQKG